MRFRFIAAEKAEFPVRLLCRTLQVSRAGFYSVAATTADGAGARR